MENLVTWRGMDILLLIHNYVAFITSCELVEHIQNMCLFCHFLRICACFVMFSEFVLVLPCSFYYNFFFIIIF